MIYQNYHRHSSYSNIMTTDSMMMNVDYAKRAVELGHGIISSCEHGWQGNYYNCYDLAKKYNLKFIFGTEAYWVKDRFEKDRANAHICIFAKTEKGRKAINRILSEANITGYYYRPRVDLELILSLPPDDVFLTSACIGFWKYDDIEDVLDKLHGYFKDNFMLEVQYHNCLPQQELNAKILKYATKNNAKIIMGCDSHYITPDQEQERLDGLEAKGIKYEDENDWYMDYPDGEEAFDRFKKQGILTDEQIYEAMNNTNIFLRFDDITFCDDIKLPSLYLDSTQEQKDELYKKIIMKSWKEFSKDIPIELHNRYKEEIRKEVRTVVNTKMTDYFLIDYELVKAAIEDGGVITNSGRGSSVSFVTNTLLGFSKVDRVSAPVHLYPERFMSETRILQTRSLPDLDLNCGNPDVFAKAQEKVLGEGHSYPMISFGTFKIKSAFKLYAKSQNLDFSIANEITSQIEKYERDLKYADDDDRDLIDIYDYVEEKYHHILKGSEKYTGIISDKKAHNCGYLIYQGNIREDIGLIKCKSESTGKETITTVIDGAVAEKYKFLKNDLLKVDVVLIIDKIYKKIGIKPHTVNELMNIIKDNEKVWNVYEKGLTVGINQVEKESTTKKVMKFKPKNISELTAFIAAIRPAFKSMYSIFESRESFEYGIPNFDNLIQTPEMPNSFMLYQEQTMATLNYAGFPQDETYGIIKAISKKKPDVIRPLKEKFLKGFSEKIMASEDISIDNAHEMSDRVWQIVEDSAGYGFNASHAYSYALDSAYCAYLKSHYPFEFYEVILQVYSDKKNKAKVALLKQEMQKVGIGIGELKFGTDNRVFKADIENNRINQSLPSVKFLNQAFANDIYDLSKKQYNNFIDLLYDVTALKSCNARKLNILTTLNYFDMFGQNKKLLDFISYFNKFAHASQMKKETFNKLELPDYIITKNSRETDKTYMDLNVRNILNEIWDIVDDKKIKLTEQAKKEVEYLDYIVLKEPKIGNDYYIIAEIKIYKDKLKPYIVLYHVKEGNTVVMKVTDSRLYAERKFKLYDLIKVRETSKERKNVLINGKYRRSKTEFNTILSDWIVV